MEFLEVSKVEQENVAKNMQTIGESFIKNLGTTISKADEKTVRKIKRAFRNDWERHNY